jgi:hypothetical protein
MGEVYRAHDERLQREVAVKVLSPQLALDPTAIERFRRESRAVAALSHPNIVAIFDVGSAGGIQYAVTELLEGETLRRRLSRGPLAPREAVQMLLDISDGVAAAHARGIIHRDLKPENVFITTTGRVKVLDFGLAREGGAPREAGGATDVLPTEPWMVHGTVGYLAPEQAEGRPVSPATDVFALGCVLYECLTGAVPFDAPSSAQAIAALLRDPAPHLPDMSEELLAAIDFVIQRALAKNPAARLTNAAALGSELRALLTDEEAVLRLSTEARRAVRRRPLRSLALSALVLLVILGAAAAVIVNRRGREVIDDGYDLRASDIRGDAETRRLISLALHVDARGNRPNAIELLEQAHRRSKETALAAAFLSSFFDAAGNGKNADAWGREVAKRLDANAPTYESLLARYLMARTDEEHSKELALAQSIINLRPQAWRLRLAAAHLFLTQRDAAAALRQLKQIDIRRPDDRRLMLVLADRASLGDVAGAERDLLQSRLASRPAFLAYTRARIAWTRGDPATAIRDYEACATYAAADSLTNLEIDARVYQALAYIRRGDLDGARRSLAIATARSRQIDVEQREFDSVALGAYVAWRDGDADERDRRLIEAHRHLTIVADEAALRLLAIRSRSEVWKQWPRPNTQSQPILTGVGSLIDAREAWLAGDLVPAQRNLRRARSEGIDGTGFREDAELLSAELGQPSVLLSPDPPYPNILRFAAIFDLERLRREPTKVSTPPRT